MKRCIVLLFCIIPMILSGCEKPSSAYPDTIPEPSQPPSDSTFSYPGIDASYSPLPSSTVSTAPLDVTITVPSLYVCGGDVHRLIFAAQEAKTLKTTRHKDGSCTYTMTKDTQKKLQTAVRKVILPEIDAIKGQISYIKDIKCNDDFTDVKVTVDRKAYEVASGVPVNLIFMCGFYQPYNGKSATKTEVTYHFIDEKTNKEFHKEVMP